MAKLKRAIAEKQMWLIHEINPWMLLERGGYAIQPARQLLALMRRSWNFRR